MTYALSTIEQPQQQRDLLSIRTLTAADWADYRELRLDALEHDGKWFTSQIKTEASRSAGQWASMCQETATQAIFGAFVDDELIASMNAEQWEADPTGRTVYWNSAFVSPRYRRRGVGRCLYVSRIDWSRSRSFTNAVFSVHHDNKRAIDIHERNGAFVFSEAERQFADGQIHKVYWFRKML